MKTYSKGFRNGFHWHIPELQPDQVVAWDGTTYFSGSGPRHGWPSQSAGTYKPVLGDWTRYPVGFIAAEYCRLVKRIKNFKLDGTVTINFRSEFLASGWSSPDTQYESVSLDATVKTPYAHPIGDVESTLILPSRSCSPASGLPGGSYSTIRTTPEYFNGMYPPGDPFWSTPAAYEDIQFYELLTDSSRRRMGLSSFSVQLAMDLVDVIKTVSDGLFWPRIDGLSIGYNLQLIYPSVDDYGHSNLSPAGYPWADHTPSLVSGYTTIGPPGTDEYELATSFQILGKTIKVKGNKDTGASSDPETGALDFNIVVGDLWEY